MNCRICGAELKKDGELCTNCMNKLMKEQELRNDKSEVYSFKRSFVLGFEIFSHLEEIGVAVFLVVLLLANDFNQYWMYALGVGVVFAIVGLGYLLKQKLRMQREVCTLYRTKLVMTKGWFKKKYLEIPFSEIEEIMYTQRKSQELFNIGTIVVKRKTRNILERNLYIESVKNVQEVFGKIKEVFK